MFESTSPGDIASYSIRDGYLDAIVRGMQLGLLGKADYDNLTQCDSLDGTSTACLLIYSSDMKMQLQQTTYGDFLVNEPSPLHTTTIAEKCTQKMVEDFEYLRTNSTYPLSKFLDYITYGKS
jgi:V-type H+-transporting ATPase subunit d